MPATALAQQNPPARDARFRRELVALIPHLRAFARSLVGEPAAADDLAQDAMMRAWSARASFRLGTNMKAWTFMILRNQFYSEKRRAWRRTQLDPEAAENALVAPDDPAQAVSLDELRLALRRLPDEQREAVVLVGAGGLAYEEAAAICGLPVGTMKSRVSRARKALIRLIEHGVLRSDGRAAGEAMNALLSEAAQLAARRRQRPPRARCGAGLTRRPALPTPVAAG